MPIEQAKTVYKTGVVEEKYWYWDEKGAANYITMTQEESYDVLEKTLELLQRELHNIIDKTFEFFKIVHPTSGGLPPIDLIVLGVGSAIKEHLILDTIMRRYGYPATRKFGPVNYIPIDISFPLLQNSLRSIFANEDMSACILHKSLLINPVLTDFLTGLTGFLGKRAGKLIVAQGIVWNAPIPDLFATFQRLLTPDSLLFIDVEFIGGRTDEEIKSSYQGPGAKAFFYHPLELLYTAAQAKQDEVFYANGEAVSYHNAFADISERRGDIIPTIVQRSTLDAFIKQHGLPAEAKSRIRLSPSGKSKTVVILYKPKVQGGNSRTIVLGYSTRFEYDEFKKFLNEADLEPLGEWLDNPEHPERAIFGHYLLKLKKKGKGSGKKPSPHVIRIGPEGKQQGVIGKSNGNPVEFDLSSPHIVFVCGKQGSGKGYTIGVLCEMLASKSIPNISEASEKATIIVLHKPREDERSEFWSMTMPNDNDEDKKKLRAEYEVDPRGVVSERDVRIFVDPLVYESKAIEEFRKDYETSNVYPLHVDPSTLQANDWATILSTVGTTDDSYVKKLFYTVADLYSMGHISIDSIRDQVQKDTTLTDGQRNSAKLTLDLLGRYLTVKNQDFVSNLALGGVNIFDFREKDKVMLYPKDLFAIITLILSAIQTRKNLKNKPFAFVINEAHEYFKSGISDEFVDSLLYIIRRKRWGPRWLILDTQLPNDVAEKVIELTDVKIVHSLDKAVKNNVLTETFREVAEKFSELHKGQTYIVADESSEGKNKPVLVKIRPRLTKHGALTKTLG